MQFSDGSFKFVQFYLINSVFDKSAKASALNIINSTGKFGCHVCLQEGESIRTFNGGHVVLYKYNNDKPKGTPRKDSTYLSDVNNAIINNKPVNGIKGLCTLNYLKFYRPLGCTNIDYMHSVVEGVYRFIN